MTELAIISIIVALESLAIRFGWFKLFIVDYDYQMTANQIVHNKGMEFYGFAQILRFYFKDTERRKRISNFKIREIRPMV